MAEAKIGALAVEVKADTRGFVDGMNDAIKALNKKKKAVEDSLVGVGKLAAAVAAAGAAVGYFTVRATNMAEALAKLSEKTGVSVEQLSALKYAAYLSDVSIEELAKGMNILARNMLEAQSGTGEAKDAFNALGIAVMETGGQLKATDKMLLELADKFSRMEDGPGKAALAMRIFGRSGADLIPFLNQGAAGIEKLRQEAERLGIILDTQMAKEAQEFNDNLKRLQATGDALSISFTKNLVVALDKAAKAMLEGHKAGQSFFDTMVEGLRTLAGGDDMHKWNVEMDEMTSRLLDLKNTRDRLAKGDTSGMGLMGESQEDTIKRATAEVNAAIKFLEAKIETHKRIKETLTGRGDMRVANEGEEGFIGPPRPKEKAGVITNEKALQAERDLIAEQWEWWMEEERRIQAEIAQILTDQNTAKLEQQKAFEEERLRVIFDAIDREQERAIEAGEEELKIREEQLRRRKEMEQNFMTFMGNLGGLMNTNNKKLFEIGKKFAIADAAIKGTKAVMDAWAAGMSVGGPWAPVVAAAYAAAAAINSLNLINNIRSQQFGGGGGAPIAPTQGASGISDQGLGGGQTAAPQQTTIIRLQGDTFDQKSVRNLVSSLNESMKNGGKILIA